MLIRIRCSLNRTNRRHPTLRFWTIEFYHSNWLYNPNEILSKKNREQKLALLPSSSSSSSTCRESTFNWVARPIHECECEYECECLNSTTTEQNAHPGRKPVRTSSVFIAELINYLDSGSGPSHCVLYPTPLVCAFAFGSPFVFRSGTSPFPFLAHFCHFSWG